MTQRAFGSSLNHRPVSHRIAERDANFDHRRAGVIKFENQLAGGIQIRVAGRDEGNEALLPVLLQPRKRFGDSTQNTFTTEDTEKTEKPSLTMVSPLIPCEPLCPLWFIYSRRRVARERYRYPCRRDPTN